MNEKELKEFAYQPNSEPKNLYFARLEKLSTQDLKTMLGFSLSKDTKSFIRGLIYSRTSRENDTNPHPDGTEGTQY